VGTCDIAVYKNLLALKDDSQDLFEEMEDHLSKRPFVNIKGKYFTMKQYYAKEYRFKLKVRVYLQVYPDQRRVYIFGAGAHPKEKVPKPPKDESIEWSKFMAI
jgi:hypothetical protein